MLPYDATGKNGCQIILPNSFTINEPKIVEEEELRNPVLSA